MNKYYSIGAVAAILTTAADAQYLLRKRHTVPQDNSDLIWKDGRDRLSFRGVQYRWLQDEVVKSMSMSMSMVSAVEDAATTDATPQELYYSLSWADLPSHIQVAYEELGYTETLWDEDGDARTDSMKWADLSEAEQAAALAIGYTQELWDADVVSTLDEPVIAENDEAATSTPEELYYSLAWADLPSDIQADYTTLGYTESLWNSDGDAPVESLTWEELPPEQLAAALAIGYTQELWDAGVASAPIGSDGPIGSDVPVEEDPPAPSPEDYYVMWWSELPGEIKDAFRILGYNRKMWNSGGNPDTIEQYWDALTLIEQAAARTIGYTQESWDRSR